MALADQKLAEIKDRLDAECVEAKGERDLYCQHLVSGGDPADWKFPWNKTEDYEALNNAHRMDAEQRPIPYLPGSEAYTVCSFMLDDRPGEWVTVADIMQALKAGRHPSWRRSIQLQSMLKNWALAHVGLALEKTAKSPVKYRLVAALVEVD